MREIHQPSKWVHNITGLVLKLQLIVGNLSIMFQPMTHGLVYLFYLWKLLRLQGCRTAFVCGTANEVRKDERSEANASGFSFLQFDFLNG